MDEERASRWTDEELAERYTTLYPMAKRQWQAKLSKTARGKLLGEWRFRLSSVSWMMRALSEFIARKANKEDGTRGRFWEGRFKSQAILDETGLLTCMAYVDLNPVRAHLTMSLEASDFTSIQERLLDLAKKREQRRKLNAPKTLAPMHGQDSGRQSCHGLPMGLNDYVALLRWTAGLDSVKHVGPEVAAAKRNEDCESTLLRDRGINPAGWLAAMKEHSLGTTSFLGSVQSLEELASKRGRKWLRGIGVARRMEVANTA